jgi:hypothetical protein
MGYYIDRTTSGVLPTTGKANFLIRHGGIQIPQPKQWVENLVCVVENGMFDAAGYMYSQSEMDQFADPRDTRRKT